MVLRSVTGIRGHLWMSTGYNWSWTNLSHYRQDSQGKSSRIHLRHVKTDEEFEWQGSFLRGIVAVINPVDLPILQADV